MDSFSTHLQVKLIVISTRHCGSITRMSSSACIRTRHWTWSYLSSIQLPSSQHISLLLLCHPSGRSRRSFSTKILYAILVSPILAVHTSFFNFSIINHIRWAVRLCIQKFPDWPPGARTANGTALCHYLQLYRYFVSQSIEFCRHNPSSYRLSPETSGYTLI
jgi:hypothetical protein